jgi:hypothetical protein
LGGEVVEFGDEVLPGDAVGDQSPKHSRACSSMLETKLIGRPSVVTLNW